MKKILLKTLIAITASICIVNTANANSSTMLVKNRTQGQDISIIVYGDKHAQVTEEKILSSQETSPQNWVIPHWFWQDDAFDYIDVFYMENDKKIPCGTIDPQVIPYGTTINRAVYIKQCDMRGLNYHFLDMVTVK